MPTIQELKPTVRILVVDDEPSFVRYLEWMLARAGYRRVTSVTDPHSAAEAFLETRPDLVLLDLEMRSVDGMSVLRRLESHIADVPALPVVVLAREESVALRRRALSLGATDFVAKPVDRFEVVRRVGELLEARFAEARQLEREAGRGGPARSRARAEPVPA